MSNPIAAVAVAAPVAVDPIVAAAGNAALAGGGFDFASLLLAQVDLGGELAPASEPIDADPEPASTGNNGSVDASLAALLNAIVLPTAGPPAVPAEGVTTPRGNADVAAVATAPLPAQGTATVAPGVAEAAATDVPNTGLAAAATPTATADAATTTAAAIVPTPASPTASAPLPAAVASPTAARIADPAFAKPAIESADNVGKATAPATEPATADAATVSAAAHVTPQQRPAPMPQLRVDTPFGAQNWAIDVGQRVVWMARQDMQGAQLSINPPNLGPIEVNLSVGRDHATAIFSSPHAEVREALEAALPRLREMLASAGISLGQAHVSSQGQSQGGHPDQAGNRASSRFADGSILPGDTDTRSLQRVYLHGGSGLVDTFA
jgi:flagellar hook-length control protein FliK